ncbi:hypothetical protein C8R45DRAFT_932369 [Mycena sanguinolenta]|nr:hypothetical protein C8R45DRAFT_932369 [Mycena sanguinolenta]
MHRESFPSRMNHSPFQSSTRHSNPRGTPTVYTARSRTKWVSTSSRDDSTLKVEFKIIHSTGELAMQPWVKQGQTYGVSRNKADFPFLVGICQAFQSANSHTTVLGARMHIEMETPDQSQNRILHVVDVNFIWLDVRYDRFEQEEQGNDSLILGICRRVASSSLLAACLFPYRFSPSERGRHLTRRPPQHSRPHRGHSRWPSRLFHTRGWRASSDRLLAISLTTKTCARREKGRRYRYAPEKKEREGGVEWRGGKYQRRGRAGNMVPEPAPAYEREQTPADGVHVPEIASAAAPTIRMGGLGHGAPGVQAAGRVMRTVESAARRTPFAGAGDHTQGTASKPKPAPAVEMSVGGGGSDQRSSSFKPERI